MKSIVFAALILVASSNGQPERCSSHLNEMNLFGKVKEIKEVSYQPIVNSDTISDLLLLSEHAYIFNSNGNIIKEVRKQYESGLEAIVKYHYGDLNLCQKQLFFESEGRLALKLIYGYDEVGKLIGQTGYDEHETIVSRIEYQYNDSGFLCKMITFLQEQNIRYEETYLYDESGRLQSTSFLPEQDSIRKVNFEYDSVGNAILKTFLGKENRCLEYHYKYSYDAHKNWVKRIEMIDNKIVDVKTRFISYY